MFLWFDKQQEALLYWEGDRALAQVAHRGLESPSLEILQGPLNTVLSSWVKVNLLEQGDWTRQSAEVPSTSMILWFSLLPHTSFAHLSVLRISMFWQDGPQPSLLGFCRVTWEIPVPPGGCCWWTTRSFCRVLYDSFAKTGTSEKEHGFPVVKFCPASLFGGVSLASWQTFLDALLQWFWKHGLCITLYVPLDLKDNFNYIKYYNINSIKS